jgi:hypothetical protein
MKNYPSVITVPGDPASGGQEKYYLTVLPSEVVVKYGLIPEAIVGEYLERPDDAPLNPDKFLANSVFKNFLHNFIETFAAEPEVMAEAKRIQNGTVTVIDQRVQNLNSRIQLEDIIGGFAVEAGAVVRYHSNPNHRLLNEHGVFQLPPAMMSSLIDRLESLSRNEG